MANSVLLMPESVFCIDQNEHRSNCLAYTYTPSIFVFLGVRSGATPDVYKLYYTEVSRLNIGKSSVWFHKKGETTTSPSAFLKHRLYNTTSLFVSDMSQKLLGKNLDSIRIEMPPQFVVVA